MSGHPELARSEELQQLGWLYEHDLDVLLLAAGGRCNDAGSWRKEGPLHSLHSARVKVERAESLEPGDDATGLFEQLAAHRDRWILPRLDESARKLERASLYRRPVLPDERDAPVIEDR